MAQNPEAKREKTDKFNHWKIKTSTLKRKTCGKSKYIGKNWDKLRKIIFNSGDRGITFQNLKSQ